MNWKIISRNTALTVICLIGFMCLIFGGKGISEWLETDFPRLADAACESLAKDERTGIGSMKEIASHIRTHTGYGNKVLYHVSHNGNDIYIVTGEGSISMCAVKKNYF
jgi:hypothetical protein